MSAPYKKTEADLRKELGEQRAMLRASCISFDEGNEWEAARIATVITNLFHTRGRTVGLLNRLGLTGKLVFQSKAYFNKRNMMDEFPLIGLLMGPRNSFMPMLDRSTEAPIPMRFPRWWSEKVFHGKNPDLKLARNELILALRNTDGGGHVDGELKNEAYVKFSRTLAFTYQRYSADGQAIGPEGQIVGAANATMRHIAWEVETALSELARDGLVPQIDPPVYVPQIPPYVMPDD